MRSRQTPLDLRQARPTDPFVRWRLDDDAVIDAVVDGDHVGWTRWSDSGDERWATVLGDDATRVVALAHVLDEVAPIDGLTVPDAAFSSLPKHLASPDPGHWSPWFIDPQDVPARHADAVELTPDDPRIDQVLVHSTSAEAFAGDPRVHRWTGVLDGQRLLAVAAERRRANGAAHLLSVCTVPEARGRGLARHACLLLMQRARAEGVEMIFLEMYAANESGRRAYSALGFVEAGTYRSGLLERGGRRVPA